MFTFTWTMGHVTMGERGRRRLCHTGVQPRTKPERRTQGRPSSTETTGLEREDVVLEFINLQTKCQENS